MKGIFTDHPRSVPSPPACDRSEPAVKGRRGERVRVRGATETEGVTKSDGSRSL